ncbi:hypothetical protein V8G61_05460 [Gaetbulibacter sp. M240]|uniref:hypothetical protein n=1 Tax=Gaetbulibacter sp. M240 TaxID=3126511 RepID=UPI00374EA59B
MKNLTQMIWLFLFVFGISFAQQEKGIIGTDNWLKNWTEFNPNQEDPGEPTQILTGKISKDTRLNKGEVYLLLGNVFVVDSVTLTIDPGTVILGDFKTKASLTIAKGAKLVAEGTVTDPIVFTSNRDVKRAGDWGGLIILGEAPSNKFGNGSVASYFPELNPMDYPKTNFGGNNIKSNSGTLRYVRIEYAGKRMRDGYFSSLMLAGVGNKTVLENIMVSYSGGNSFQVWGGDLNMDKLVSYKSSGNDFKFNFGSQVVLNNSLAIRSPFVSSSYKARCLVVSSYDEQREVDFSKKLTHVVAKNITLLNDSNDLKSDISRGLVNEAVYVGKTASLDMNQSVISGFNPAVLFEESIVVNQENLERIKFTDMYFNNCNGNIFVEYNSNNEDLENWYGNSSFLNVYSKSNNDETFIDINNKKRPDFRLRINKIIASEKDNFASEDLGVNND